MALEVLDPGIFPNNESLAERTSITLALSVPLGPSFYFNESTINKEMERHPIGSTHNSGLLLSMAVLNSFAGPY